MTPKTPLLATELYAFSQGAKCDGPLECYWCSAPCKTFWLHGENPPIAFVKAPVYARRPGNPHICTGCWLFRRKRITVNYLDGTLKDVQCPLFNSWFITREQALAVRKTEATTLYEMLLNPPNCFTLSLVSDGTPNRLHQASVNEHEHLRADTPLTFTLDNKPLSYTSYELGLALKSPEEELEGKEPGVRALIHFLGHPGCPPAKKPEKLGRGRPAKEVYVNESKLSLANQPAVTSGR